MRRRGEPQTRRWSSVLTGMVAAAICFGAVPLLCLDAGVASAMVMEMDFPNVGEHIPLMSFDFGMSRTPAGEGGGGGRTQVRDVRVTKVQDAASAKLMRACANGTKARTMTVRLCSPDGCGQQYLMVTLQDVYITSYQTGGSSDDARPSESLTLNFTKVDMTFVEEGETVELTKRGGSWELGGS